MYIPDCVNVILKVSRRKKSKMVPTFYPMFLTKCLSKCQVPPPPARKNFCLRTCTQALFFCKMLHLTCLTEFWILLCLDNCSVNCTATIYEGIVRLIQAYSESTLCNPHIFTNLPYSEPWHI